MPPESPRIAELRRRVHADPASIAFAQLAEEYRRAGNYEEAVRYCRSGLARHPGYLSARVTLGRALMELGELDAAIGEFDLVLRSAPDNLAAIRAIAEIQQRRGALALALDYYKRALALARFDPELEESVARITREMGRVSAPPAHLELSFEEATSQLVAAASRISETIPATPTVTVADPVASPAREEAPERDSIPAVGAAAEPLIDFDALLASLGVADAAPPPVMELLLSQPPTAGFGSEPAWPAAPADAPTDNPFAELERELRALEVTTPSVANRGGRVAEGIGAVEQKIIAELEAWLRVLHAERAASPTV